MNKLQQFVWDKHGDNDYIVTDLTTGNCIFVTKAPERGMYHIDGVVTTNCYGQKIPKLMSTFEVMNYLKNVKYNNPSEEEGE